jgi:hypothetical protein
MKKSYKDYPIQEDTMEPITPPVKEPTVLQKASYENEQNYNRYNAADNEAIKLRSRLVAGRAAISAELEERRSIEYDAKRRGIEQDSAALVASTKRTNEVAAKVGEVEKQVADKEREVDSLKRIWQNSQREYRALAAYAHSGAR